MGGRRVIGREGGLLMEMEGERGNREEEEEEG